MNFEPVEAVFRRNRENGEDLGASVCITVDGETVVDLWGGWRGGHGGSLAIIDMDARTTMAHAMNRMGSTTTGDLRGLGLAVAAWGALGVI